MSDVRRVGREAEDAVAAYLFEAGWTIITRRYKARRGEIDIVALDGDELVFVEVKARRAEGYSPEESIGETKMAALLRAARAYLEDVGHPDRAFRLDVVAVDRDGMRHHRNILVR